MFSINIDVAAFTKSLVEARKRFAHAILTAVQRAAELAREYAQGTDLFEDQTGSLRRSIQVKHVSDHEVRVVTDSPHAAWVERGNGFRTGATVIKPLHAPFLVFDFRGNHFEVKQVRTSTPRPFMATARDRTVPFFEALCTEAVENMFTG